MPWKKGQPRATSAGRKKGVPNKFTAQLKTAILNAAADMGGGGQDGLEAFLRQQAAKENNAPFMSLLARVLPSTLTADEDSGPITVVINRFTDDDGLVTADTSKAIDGDYRRLTGPTDNI
jgi:hypothetical protein